MGPVAPEPGTPAGRAVLERAPRLLVEADVLPLLASCRRAAAAAGCLALLAVAASTVLLPAAATAVLFLSPAAGGSWLRLAGLLAAMMLLASAVVVGASRLGTRLAERATARRVSHYNERQAERARALLAAFATGDEPLATGDAEATAVRLAYLAEWVSPLRLARRPASLVPARLLGLSLWTVRGGEAEPIASFLSSIGEGIDLDDLDPDERFAELPLAELTDALRRRGLHVEPLTARFRLP